MDVKSYHSVTGLVSHFDLSEIVPLAIYVFETKAQKEDEKVVAREMMIALVEIPILEMAASLRKEVFR